MTTPKAKKSNTFSDAMEASVGAKAPYCSGENGSDMYTMYGVSGTNEPTMGALTALFNGVIDTTSHETIVEYVENVMSTLDRARDLTSEQKANFLADLVVAAFQVRNIRGNGKGRRDQAYSMWVELLWRFPETMMALLPELKEHGSWLDYNKILDKYHGQPKYKTFGLHRLVDAIYDLYAEQIKVDRETLDDYTKRKSISEHQDPSHLWEEKCELSLAVKWMPKEGRALDKKIKCTKEIARRIFPELFTKEFKVGDGHPMALKALRKFYAPIQLAIKTTEVLECAREFHKIDFRFVPGKTVFKKKKAYLYEQKRGGELRGDDEDRLECRDHYMSHLEKAVTGKAKVHGITVYIHELVSAVYTNWQHLTKGDRLTYDAQFQSHVDHFKKLMEEKGLAIDKGIFMADVSGSMQGNPMAAAIAVALLGSTLSGGPWKNKFMTFETTPHWVTLEYPKDHINFKAMIGGGTGGYRNSLGNGACSHPLGIWDSSRAGGELTFCEKVGVCYTSRWGGSTDFLAAHDLMLSIAIEHKIAPEDYPSWFLCASDMQFNQARSACSPQHPTMSKIMKANVFKSRMQSSNCNGFADHPQLLVDIYKLAGYKPPQMIYWNMRDTKKSVTTSSTTNVQMVSGFSTMQLKLFLENLDFVEGEQGEQGEQGETGDGKVTPWDTFRKAMDDEDYDDVRSTIARVGEGIFHHYNFNPLTLTLPLESTDGSPLGSPPNTTTRSSLYRLRDVKKMMDEGLINEQEYDIEKAKILESM